MFTFVPRVAALHDAISATRAPTFSVVPIQHLNAQFCSKRTDVRCVRNLTVLVSSKQPSPGWLPAVYPRHPPRPPPHADCLARDITSPDYLLCCCYHFYGCRLPFFWQGRAVHAEVMDCWSWWLAFFGEVSESFVPFSIDWDTFTVFI